ncbi:MAG TPA: helix-turn-helix transcriptional regulator [Terriglobales bacterium]|jgi:XRE family aerobic/anaerobic benzoate catabolism transcriptional regulator|nr:helix-turn-helix transcriptional regulator [Terriglobales bacterium]
MKRSSHNGTGSAFDHTSARKTDERPRPSDSEYLRLLGETVRAIRTRRGMTRKMLASQSGVSERFLAQLESGTGNASVLILRQISQALGLSLEAMLPGAQDASAEMKSAVELLQRLEPVELTEARGFLLQRFGPKYTESDRHQRVALIGLRGAGKSTVGKLLARKLELQFFELDRLIEQTSGISLSMIFDLYGQSGFRRFERRCLDDLLNTQPRFVVATGGSLVSEPDTYERLLANCYTIWLQATPSEHMSRVIAQGDMRPMAQNPEAMEDLERILQEREELYRRADASIDTSGKTVEEVVGEGLQSLERMAGSISG